MRIQSDPTKLGKLKFEVRHNPTNFWLVHWKCPKSLATLSSYLPKITYPDWTKR